MALKETSKKLASTSQEKKNFYWASIADFENVLFKLKLVALFVSYQPRIYLKLLARKDSVEKRPLDVSRIIATAFKTHRILKRSGSCLGNFLAINNVKSSRRKYHV